MIARRYSRHRLHGPFMEVQKYRLRPVCVLTLLSQPVFTRRCRGQYIIISRSRSRSRARASERIELFPSWIFGNIRDPRTRQATKTDDEMHSTRWRTDTVDNVCTNARARDVCVHARFMRRVRVCVYVCTYDYVTHVAAKAPRTRLRFHTRVTITITPRSDKCSLCVLSHAGAFGTSSLS